MTSLLSLVKTHGTPKSIVTTVTTVTASNGAASHGNDTKSATVTTVTQPPGNGSEVTTVTMHEKPSLPEKGNDFERVTTVTTVTVKNDDAGVCAEQPPMPEPDASPLVASPALAEVDRFFAMAVEHVFPDGTGGWIDPAFLKCLEAAAKSERTRLRLREVEA